MERRATGFLLVARPNLDQNPNPQTTDWTLVPVWKTTMKPILCLEATWYANSPITVQPFLETLRMLEGVSFVRYPCDTVRDLEHFLSKPVKGKPGILYLAMHGRKGKLSFSDTNEKEMVSITEVAKMMKKRYRHWHVHFASCETINTTDRIFQEFKQATGASVVSGYMKQVDWIEGYALDMLLMQKAQRYARPAFLVKSMYNNYSDLITRTGLYIE